MKKDVIDIKAESKEMAEKLARGVWAVCPDAEIRLFYPRTWQGPSAYQGAAGAGGCGGQPVCRKGCNWQPLPAAPQQEAE